MNEKSYEINVDVVDLAYPLQIESEIRLRSRLAPSSRSTSLRMAMEIEGDYLGKGHGSIYHYIDLPKGALLPDSSLPYRPMLDAFCKAWERELQNEEAKNVTFKIILLNYDYEDPYKDVFTIKAKGN